MSCKQLSKLFYLLSGWKIVFPGACISGKYNFPAMQKALENFCNWFQMVFNDKNSHVTADYIKQLLSSGFEIHPAAFSIYIETKQIFSIPHEVAEKYHVPELSTKNQKKKFMNQEDSNVPKILPFSISNIAFGKCLPKSLKHSSPVRDDSGMKANIPDELLTDEYLFKGIEGLRSTKILIKHFDHSDHQEMKPLYFKNFKYEDDNCVNVQKIGK